MSTQQKEKSSVLRAENIGGIDETEVTFTPGITVLKGDNATNRTSLLQAIMAALGGNDVSIKGDSDEAYAELEIEGKTYTRELRREGSAIQSSGDPYLDDPALAELFAFLLESNEARRAVVTQQNLRDLIMRPIDTDEIQRTIDRLMEERREVEAQLEELDSLKDRLPSQEERRERLESEIEEKKGELAKKEDEIEALDADVEETRNEKAELDDLLEGLRQKRSSLEEVRYDLETERESLETIRNEKEDAEDALADLPDAPAGETDQLESELDRLRERKRLLESEVNEIQSVIGFNQEMVGDNGPEGLPHLQEPDGDVTDELLPDETVTCWTCGSDVQTELIESTIERLQELSQSKLGEVNDVETRMDEMSSEISELRQQQREREDLQGRIDRMETELDESEAKVQRLVERRETLQSEVEELQVEIEEMEDDEFDEILDLHKEANQLEYEIGRLEGELEDAKEEISDVESRIESEDDLAARRDDIDDSIEAQRTKIDRIESEAVAEFNEHMDAVLDILGYDRLERIWLERVEREVREGRRKVTKSSFELHIVRESASGMTYEDTVDHLSESERVVTGLVFALAGYLAHDLYETVPFVLLDSLEAIDAPRISRLIEYLDDHCEYLVVALLTEDAEKVEEDNLVTEI